MHREKQVRPVVLAIDTLSHTIQANTLSSQCVVVITVGLQCCVLACVYSSRRTTRICSRMSPRRWRSSEYICRTLIVPFLLLPTISLRILLLSDHAMRSLRRAELARLNKLRKAANLERYAITCRVTPPLLLCVIDNALMNVCLSLSLSVVQHSPDGGVPPPNGR